MDVILNFLMFKLRGYYRNNQSGTAILRCRNIFLGLKKEKLTKTPISLFSLNCRLALNDECNCRDLYELQRGIAQYKWSNCKNRALAGFLVSHSETCNLFFRPLHILHFRRF